MQGEDVLTSARVGELFAGGITYFDCFEVNLREFSRRDLLLGQGVELGHPELGQLCYHQGPRLEMQST